MKSIGLLHICIVLEIPLLEILPKEIHRGMHKYLAPRMYPCIICNSKTLEMACMTT